MKFHKELNMDGIVYKVGQHTTVMALIEGVVYAHTTDMVSNIIEFAGATTIYFFGGKVMRQSKWGAGTGSTTRQTRTRAYTVRRE